MREKAVFVFAFIFFMLLVNLLAPYAVFAQPAYVVFKAGGYFPTGTLGRLGYGAGFNGEISVGHYFIPRILAVEIGSGYLQTTLSQTSLTNDPILGTVTGTIENQVRAVPIIGTVKVRAPFLGLYVGAGGGFYATRLRIRAHGTKADGSPFSFNDCGWDTIAGGHVMAGLSFPITRWLFFGAEGKYIFTQKAHYFNKSYSSLDGFMATGNLMINF